MKKIIWAIALLLNTAIAFSQNNETKNVHFSNKYVQEHKGKTTVEIPEVSELVNIIMVLHKDAEKDENMFDTKSTYYQDIKNHFGKYTNHPVIDTIQKYISDLKYLEQYKINMFSRESYGYYYALKMNACAYSFDKKGNIKNNGEINEIAKGWYMFDPMKDVALFQDFAKKSNFRKFYKKHKPYYNNLIATYNKLNPIQKMQNWLDKKFGFSYGSYAVFFSPLVNGAHSTTRFESNGLAQTQMFICKAEMDTSYTPIINELLESRVVFTEIDHNYVNPITDKMLAKVNKSFSNREKWAGGEVTFAYENAYKVFNEYMTFGVYSLYVLDNYKSKDFENYIPMLEAKMVTQRNFIRFKEFNQALIGKYKQNPDISMPELYDYIIDWAARLNNEK